MPRINSLAGVALVTAAAVSFAANTTLSRIAYDGGSNVMTVLTMRTILAGVWCWRCYRYVRTAITSTSNNSPG
jgi:drug/metabolite transporter (DMT)-like permease